VSVQKRPPPAHFGRQVGARLDLLATRHVPLATRDQLTHPRKEIGIDALGLLVLPAPGQVDVIWPGVDVRSASRYAGLTVFGPLRAPRHERCERTLPWWTNGFSEESTHGSYCLGCCWLLFVILFPLGMLNIAALAAITALIFAEKSLPLGARISQLGALVLILYGLLAIFVPEVLPTIVRQGHMGMSL
jgi:hypothetical protein